jgi:hypothetical protein
MSDNLHSELGWPAVAFLLAIVLFGVVLIGHAPTWPIYVTVLAWWGFVILRGFMSPDARSEANEQNMDESRRP